MSTWAERVHRRAADFSSVVTSCGHPSTSAPAYTYHLEKVKFGVSLDEVCKNDNIPGPLLVLILKLNKESPNRRDVFRAPGHQGAMKKLIHFLQSGRLVNVDNYSVYTIASVLKKFLRKIPNGIFGRDGEKELFTINELESEAEQIERLHKLFTSLPKYTQHLLVLLFGTFRVIASNAVHAATGMTSEALGVSVAPSFFQSCVSDGKTARMEDVLKFKVATKIMKNIIDKFATHDLFGRDNYEYYARVTGRILKVQDEWICSFQYPPPPRGKLAQQKYALQHSLEAEKTWLQCQCERWGLLAQEESRSTPALLTSSSSALDNSVVSLGVTPEHSFMESCARLSVSLEGPGLFAMTSSPLPKRHSSSNNHDLHHDDKDDDDEDDNIEDEDDYEHDDDDYEQDDDNEYDDNDNNSEHEQRKRNYFATTAVLDGITMHKYDNQNESMDNFSKNINYAATATTTTTATTSPTASTAQSRVTRRLKTKSSKTTNAANDSLTDDIEEAGNSSGGGGGGIVVKRRYKQNKKKASTTNAANSSNNSSAAQIRSQQQQQQQHLRRLRSSSGNTKSLDISSLTTNSSQNCDFLLLNMMNSGDYENIQPGPLYHAASNSTLKGSDFSKQYPLQKARVCSRCKRGIRHSSSCSSSTASGGGGGGVGGAGVNGAGNGTATNGNGMTLEELRAVNRYAESTKSLSYLPQVRDEYLLASRISV